MSRQPATLGLVATAVAVAAALVSIGSAVYTVLADRRDDQNARAEQARSARHDVVADILQMGQYDDEGGAGNQAEILVLAGDALQLIDDFGPDRLHLSPMAYRQMAEYVTYSTREPELALELVDLLLDAAEPGSNELVFAHRVLGDLAAQTLDPERLESEYDQALELNKDFRAREPQLGREVDEFTTAHRLLSAYIGASLSRDLPTVHERFCALTVRWQGDRHLVVERARNDRIDGQLRRLDARDTARLDDVCAPTPDGTADPAP